MATNTPGPAGAPLLETLTANRQGLGIGLLALGAALGAIPITFVVREGNGALELIVWGAVLSLTSLAAGAICLTVQPRANISEAEQVGLVLLVLGGVVGFATTLLGLIVPVTRYASIFGGGLKEWSKHPLTVWLCAAAVLGGLGLMFVSLLLARGMERKNALMRRLIYGYIAFFSSFLLLAVLLLINVLAYTPLPAFGALQKTYDWTANAVYTLSPGTTAQLAALKKPVHVIVLLSGGSEARPAMETLLENCREVQPNLTWEEYSPEQLARDDPEKYIELRQKYELREMAGMVVVYGNDASSSYTFVPESDLSQQPPPSFEEQPSSSKVTFKGEAALTTAIDFLEAGKAKTIIYFTQGNGELSFAPERGEEQGNGGLSLLIELLSGGNYDMRPLPLGPLTKEVPSDADIVVIARPRYPLPAPAVDALRAFLEGTKDKRGKLIALLNPAAPGGPDYDDPELDKLLAQYDVSLGHDRILSATTRTPPMVRVKADQNSTNVLAQFFSQFGRIPFVNVQTVRPETTNPAYRAETLLQADFNGLIWSQKDLHASVDALVEEARQEVEQRKGDRFSRTPIPVAVAVTSSGGAPPIPGHEFLGGKPVLTVYGDGSWISDEALAGPNKEIPLSLFRANVDWMRERATLAEQLKTKNGVERDEFSLAKITPATASAITWTPGFVMLAGIVALGLGLALVRRR